MSDISFAADLKYLSHCVFATDLLHVFEADSGFCYAIGLDPESVYLTAVGSDSEPDFDLESV